jgi:hypothetical protein
LKRFHQGGEACGKQAPVMLTYGKATCRRPHSRAARRVFDQTQQGCRQARRITGRYGKARATCGQKPRGLTRAGADHGPASRQPIHQLIGRGPFGEGRAIGQDMQSYLTAGKKSRHIMFGHWWQKAEI